MIPPAPIYAVICCVLLCSKSNIELKMPCPSEYFHYLEKFACTMLMFHRPTELLYHRKWILHQTRFRCARLARPMLTSVNISPFSYNNIFIIRPGHSNIMYDVLTSKFAVVISSKLASCLQNAYM